MTTGHQYFDDAINRSDRLRVAWEHAHIGSEGGYHVVLDIYPVAKLVFIELAILNNLHEYGYQVARFQKMLDTDDWERRVLRVHSRALREMDRKSKPCLRLKFRKRS